VKDPSGRKVVDFARSNLHVMSYSRPIRARLTLDELRPHLFSLPDHPDWIPYRTSYYDENWGFCLSHRQLLGLPDGEYEVCIESSLSDGHLTYGECHLHGASPEEVLISCHVCHPSLGNDNLSGIALATLLAGRLAARPRRYSYRFLFIPGTIGSITWLSLNEARTPAIRHGLVLTCVGDPARATYKRSRRGDAAIDRAAAHVLRHSGDDHRVVDFSPYGYDERQYCSPGFNLPVGCFMRSAHGEFPEYHTSADDLGFVSTEALLDSFAKVAGILHVLDGDGTFVNTSPKGEPRLGKRGIYRAIGGSADDRSEEMALLWVLNLSDGTRTLLDVAERAGLPFRAVRRAADVLLEHGLLREVPGAG
jgi:aminopeptidase-like protein